jgi:ArsR family transcriptional regulator, arsenate/arsenite/antimonite-responsive transcriptional repressor
MNDKPDFSNTTDLGCCLGDAIANQLKALGHPVRIEIINQLLTRDRCCCGDICASLPLAQSTISQHVDVLRRAGLVDFEPDGNRSRYSVNRTAFKALAQAIGRMAEEREIADG